MFDSSFLTLPLRRSRLRLPWCPSDCATAARAESVADLAVIGRAPTTMTIPYVGRTPQAVRLDVREAAGIVCDAALTNGELEPLDRQWCRDKATARTLRTYAKLRAQYLADAAPLQVRVLASR